MPICPKCGATVNNSFCPYCGSAVPADSTPVEEPFSLKKKSLGGPQSASGLSGAYGQSVYGQTPVARPTATQVGIPSDDYIPGQTRQIGPIKVVTVSGAEEAERLTREGFQNIAENDPELANAARKAAQGAGKAKTVIAFVIMAFVLLPFLFLSLSFCSMYVI